MTTKMQKAAAGLVAAAITLAPMISFAHADSSPKRAQAQASASLSRYSSDVTCTSAHDGTAVPPKDTLSARASSKCDDSALVPQGTDAGTVAPQADRPGGVDMPNDTTAGNSTPGGVTTANPASPAAVGNYDFGRYSSSSSSGTSVKS